MTRIEFSNLNITDEEQLCSITDEESLSVNGGFLDTPFRIFPGFPGLPWIPRPRIPRILPRC
jgi:hypothetical protein